MYRSFNSHNEMMSRNIVALDRIPELREAKAEVMKYRDALADPTKRKDLTPEQLARVTADYAKHGGQAALRLGNYIAELNHRVENSMKPRKPGRGTDLMHMLSSLTTMTYLATPSYYAIQMLGFIQTFQRMSAKYGVGRAYRNMLRAYGDLQSGKLMGKGALEGWREIQGLPDVARTGLFRRPHDFVEDAIDKLRASGTRNLDLKIRALRHAHLLGHLGQAGLDQPNLRLRNIEAGVLNKGLKGIESFTRIFRALQEGIETVNRAAPISAYVDILVENGGLSDTEIVNRAVTNMVNEQTSYAKGNWASWMNHPLAEFPMMFKKFALTQAIVFYESLAKSVAPSSSPAERSAAITHLVMVTATLAAIGGLSGNPLWEPARLGLYLLYLFGVLEAETWDETKTKGEQALAAIVGQPTAEAMMYGLPRLAGIDISSRVASDNLFTFQQPEEFTQDNIYQLIGSIAAGAPGSVILNGGSVFANVATGEYGKAFQQLPLPKTAKDIVKAYDQSVNGIRTTTGVNTGAALNIGEALATAAGFRTRTHVRPFEQGSVAQKKAKDRIKSRRQVIITDAVNNGMNAATMREVAEWNRVHPAKEERITVKTLIAARKRRRDIEKEIREANKE
jgi:hypothetical protein